MTKECESAYRKGRISVIKEVHHVCREFGDARFKEGYDQAKKEIAELKAKLEIATKSNWIEQDEPMICPECQEIECDDDCVNPRETA